MESIGHLAWEYFVQVADNSSYGGSTVSGLF
jgi:hypothetical protein